MSKATTIKKPSIAKACEIAGGQVALGEMIGRNQSFISHLLVRAQTINADVALRISEATSVPLLDIISDFSDHDARAKEPSQ